MKRKSFYVLSVVAIGAFMLASCNMGTPKASLNNQVDSLSYAYGVSLADQGLMQYLEQSGVLESSSNIEYEYQMKIAAEKDSVKKQDLQKEMNSKMDSLNKINGPKLSEFVKGLQEALEAGKEKSAYIQGLGIGQQISQQMLPQFNATVFADDTTQKINNDQLIAGMIGTLKNQHLAISKMDANEYVQNEIKAAEAKNFIQIGIHQIGPYRFSISHTSRFNSKRAFTCCKKK